MWGFFAKIARNGRLAQWLERCVDIAEVTGSNPVSPILDEGELCDSECNYLSWWVVALGVTGLPYLEFSMKLLSKTLALDTSFLLF